MREITDDDIQLAIYMTTGVGDLIPNAHRVKSWIHVFLDDTTVRVMDYGELFDRIANYIFEKYGLKTTLSDGPPIVSGPIYTVPSYTTPGPKKGEARQRRSMRE